MRQLLDTLTENLGRTIVGKSEAIRLVLVALLSGGHDKYPCMQLAYAAGRAGGSMPAVLNAANEQAVALFLEEKIEFLDIPRCIEQVCDRFSVDNRPNPSLDDIIAADNWARQEVLAASKLVKGAIA